MGEQRSKDAVFDRQYLPLPLAGLTPVHHRPRLTRLSIRPGHAVALLAAVLLALGIFLLRTAPDGTIGLRSHIMTIDGLRLHEVPTAGSGVRAFTGAASIAIRFHGDHVIATAGITTLNGRVSIGMCTMENGATTAACRFTIDGKELTSSESFDGTQWHRYYSDGRVTSIPVDPGSQLFAVPIPLGGG